MPSRCAKCSAKLGLAVEIANRCAICTKSFCYGCVNHGCQEQRAQQERERLKKKLLAEQTHDVKLESM
jgi:hypothetical protein